MQILFGIERLQLERSLARAENDDAVDDVERGTDQQTKTIRANEIGTISVVAR